MVIADYRQGVKEYLKLRGYDPDSGAWPVLKRGLLESWAQPGFHKFWQVWNPWVGYQLFRLYLFLGGNRNRVPATIAVFPVCGLLHDLAATAIVQRFSIIFAVAFFPFGILTLLMRASGNTGMSGRVPVLTR